MKWVLTRPARSGTRGCVKETADVKKLADVAQESAQIAGERRDGLRVVLTGRTLFLYAGAVKEYPRRDGTGMTTVLSFKTWTPRGDVLWMDVRRPDHITLVQGLVEGERIELAGQLVVKPRTLGGHFVSVRVHDLARA